MSTIRKAACADLDAVCRIYDQIHTAEERGEAAIGWQRGVLNRKNIPWQMAELGKVDHGGGGTVALYLAAYGMDTIDLGPAVLSMHSPFELLSKADLYSTKLAYQAILEA